MAPYANQDDVLARAGRIGGAFSVAGRRPSLADIDEFLLDVTAEINVEIRRHGFDPAALDAEVVTALRDIAAYGALAKALAGVDPSSRPDNLENLVKKAEGVWSSDASSSRRSAQIQSIIGIIEAGVGGGGTGPSAGSLWDDSDLAEALRSFPETITDSVLEDAPVFTRLTRG